MYWKNTMIAASETSMPYSRRFFLMKLGTAIFSAAGATTSTISFISSSPCGNNCAHDVFLARVRSIHLGDKRAFIHHIKAIRHPQQLRHFRRNEDDAFAFFGQLGDEAVNLVFGPHVDTPRGFVEN